jgi:hypothetical protein
MAREVGHEISLLGFTVMTGGGPGIMEAANRGAREAGGPSFACNIELPAEQDPNPYLDRFVTLDHFFIRKVLLVKYSYAFVVMPGGFGTLDEFFEILTLIQTKKVENFPVILMGLDYWKPLLEQFYTMTNEKTIHVEDLKLVKMTDRVSEALEHITTFALRSPRLKARKVTTPVPLFGEKT